MRSRRVPVAVTEFELPYTTLYGVVSRVKKRSIVYEYVLGEEQRSVLEKVRGAAERSGVSLEVVDLGRSGPLRGVFGRLLERLAEEPGLLPTRDQIRRASVLA